MTARIRSDATIAIALTRRSTDKQDLTHDAQRTAISAWAKREGITIAAWFEDDVSGGDAIEDCPGLLQAIDALPRHGAGVLVVAKRDRLARDTMKAAMLEALVKRQGAVIVSAAGEGNGDDPVQVLMRRVVDAFAEYERLIIRARTKAALQVKRARGEKTGGLAPYGYRRDASTPPRLVPVEDEQETIALIRTLRADGLAIRAIARELSSRGIRPRNGSQWHGKVIDRVLRGSSGGAKGDA